MVRRRAGVEPDPGMNLTTLLRWLSALCFISALAAIVTLLASDAWNELRLTALHRRAGALAVLLIGSSFLGLQLSSPGRWRERYKEALLAVAFMCWGAQQFVPAGPWVTAMDTAVVFIFVADLGGIIIERLKRKNQ
jgi:hypothetical protein